MSTLPDGPLPDDYKKTIADLIREVGVATMGPTILNRRLEAKYNISFAPHSAAVTQFVKEFMQTDEMRRELAIIQKQQEEGAAGGKGKKRARAPSSKSEKKKSGKEKAKTEKVKKVKKAKKPEDYPKAALSAYFFFAADYRAQHPELAMKDQMTKAGAAWRDMSEDQKKPYEDKAAADKARFEKEMEAYVAKGGEVFKRGQKEKKGQRAKKDPNLPKRALSAYFFFAADYRAQHPELAMKDQMTKAGAAWRDMNEDQKKPYEDKAAADKVRYARECEAKGITVGKSSKPKADNKDAASSSSSSDSSSADSSSDSDSSSDNDE